MKTNKDYVILIPSDCKDQEGTEKTAQDYIASVFALPDTATSETLTYDSGKALYMELDSPTKIPLGFTVEKKPVVIYCNFSEKALSASADSFNFLGSFNDVMFNVSDEDKKEIAEKYKLEENFLYLSSEKVSDQFGQYKMSVMRILLLNTVISAFLLLLEAAIISTLVRLEFKAHATELSLKKVLGYSVYKKNKLLFLLNGYAAAIGIVTVVIASLMYKYSKWYVVVAVGVVLFLLECLVVTLNVMHIEKTSVPKILKGGSL